MSIWPFGRKKSVGEKNRPTQNSTQNRSNTEPMMQRSGSQRSNGSRRSAGRLVGLDSDVPRLARKRSGRDRRRQSSREGKKLVRDPERRAYSFSPGRKEGLGVPRDIPHQHPVPPIPPNAATMAGKSANLNERNDTAIGYENLDRAPTLHKRSAHDLNHRKSSKKRKEDYERLAELKAMSKHMPPPPSRAATAPDWNSQTQQNETHKARGIKGIFTNHQSNLSLTHQSVHSSVSSNAEPHTSFILKGIDLFAPRPTIRYAENPRYKQHEASKSLSKLPATGSRADLFEKEEFKENNAMSRKRMDALANDLDAHDLRELLDRDRRRRERKKLSDQEKLARKVARRKEKQQAEVRNAVANGNARPEVMDRGVMDRGLVRLGIQTDESGPQAERGDSVASSRKSQQPENPFDDGHESPAQSLFEFVRNPSLPGTEPTSPMECEEPVVAIAQVARLSRANMSPPASPRTAPGHRRDDSNASQLKDLTPVPVVTELPKEDDFSVTQRQDRRMSAETGSSYQNSSWKSWFKRNSKERRASTQSSFSNTTRESITSSNPPMVYANPVGTSSGIPKRTMSRFREDLPELPMSPPASRVQSPEVETVRAHNHRGERVELSDSPATLRRFDSLGVDFRPAEQSQLRYETPVNDRNIPSPEPNNIMSQSLASIDSEGSWLSGRPRADSKRSSAQRSSARSFRQQYISRESHGSLQKRYREFSESPEDDVGIAKDEYFSRLTPGPEYMYDKSRTEMKRKSGMPMASSDEEDNVVSMHTPRNQNQEGKHEQEGKWGEVSRHATVMRCVPRTGSSQGVLDNMDMFSDSDFEEEKLRPRTPENNLDKNEDESDYGDSPVSPEGEVLQRATSVDFKKQHIRHISAGSARLLDMKPRASVDGKRKSVGL